MSKKFIFSSESVGEGHPDKVCDTISDYVLDACLAQDKFSRVACETYAKSNIVIVGGEITTKAKLDSSSHRPPGHPRHRLHARRRRVPRRQGVYREHHHVTQQSPDIAQGVDARKAKGKKTAEQGAGDQGLMFGYACNETPELMPAPIMFAHRLGRELTRIRKTGKVPWLRPTPNPRSRSSTKTTSPSRIPTSSSPPSTAPTSSTRQSKKFCIENVIKKVMPKRLLTEDRISRQSHRPLRRRRAAGRHRPDRPQNHRATATAAWAGTAAARSRGKDPTKVDRSAAYMGRWIAKNIVAARLAASVRNPVRLRHRPSRPRQRSREHLRHRRPSPRAGFTGPSTACSASSPPTSSSSSICSARFTRRRPTTATSAKTIPT